MRWRYRESCEFTEGQSATPVDGAVSSVWIQVYEGADEGTLQAILRSAKPYSIPQGDHLLLLADGGTED